MKTFLLSALIIVVGASCVTQKKYDELLESKIGLEEQLAGCSDSLETASITVVRLHSEIAEMKADTAKTAATIKSLNADLSALTGDHKQLRSYYNNLLGNSGKMTRDLAEQQERIMAIRESLDRSQAENERLSADLVVREQKVRELEDILARKEEAVRSLNNRISEALFNFKEKELTVSVKNGKVYVSLSEQLLFNSGSIAVDQKGAEALRQLAAAIKEEKELNIMVEGHTDDVPVSNVSRYMIDNWDLSVLRATSIVRILTGAGVAYERIVAAGRGEYAPVADNETKEGRQKNRRTAIVITPDLNELFKMLETN